MLLFKSRNFNLGISQILSKISIWLLDSINYSRLGWVNFWWCSLTYFTTTPVSFFISSYSLRLIWLFDKFNYFNSLSLLKSSNFSIWLFDKSNYVSVLNIESVILKLDPSNLLLSVNLLCAKFKKTNWGSESRISNVLKKLWERSTSLRCC